MGSLLIVDDDPVACRVLEGVARQSLPDSWEVEVAGSVIGAMNLLAEKSYDIAIIDVLLGTDLGYEICRAAKRLNPEIHVWLISGSFSAISHTLTKGCGAEKLLLKANGLDSLREVLEQYIDQLAEVGGN